MRTSRCARTFHISRRRARTRLPISSTLRLSFFVVASQHVGEPLETESVVSLHSSNPEPLMSALGQKRTLRGVRPMSALPSKADIDQHGRDVRFVPKADKVQCSNRSRLLG